MRSVAWGGFVWLCILGVFCMVGSQRQSGPAFGSRVMGGQAERGQGPGDTASLSAIQPHWTAEGCRHCHESTGQQLTPVDPARIDALCMECHDGKRASRERHPVGRIVVGEQIRVPENWPLPGGKLSCVTCHDILAACRLETPAEARAPDRRFLREFTGGDLQSFCNRCHEASGDPVRYNPHIMLDENNQIIAHACTFCHASHAHVHGAAGTLQLPEAQAAQRAGLASRDSSVLEASPAVASGGDSDLNSAIGQAGDPGAGAVSAAMARTPTAESTLPTDCSVCHQVPYHKEEVPVRSGRPHLRMPEPFLCLGCHPNHVDYFMPGHVGARVPPRMKAYMAAAERADYRFPITPEQIEEALLSGLQPSRLNLVDGAVVCSSCHNPHAEGLFPPGTTLAHGAIRHDPPAADSRLRGLGQTVCRGCHGM